MSLIVFLHFGFKSIASSFFLIAILFNSLNAKSTIVLKNGEVIVQVEEPLHNAAKEVIELYPVIKAELEKSLKLGPDFIPTIVLIKDRETFQGMTDSNIVVAFAVPQKYLVVIDYSKMNTHPFTLKTTLKHEMCHLLLHNIEKGNIPKWLEEGTCQWMSDGIAEIISHEGQSVMKKAVLSKGLISIRDLTARFPKDEKSLLLAYEESKSIVEYIIKEFGVSGLLNIFEHLKTGYDIDEAIEKVLSISLNELEMKWHNYLRNKITWVTYISNYLYEIIFFLAALITIYGFVRILIKKKAYKDKNEEEE
ncbi:MAG: peptidase MA family metallohydrolase [Nitrospirota bacterium]